MTASALDGLYFLTTIFENKNKNHAIVTCGGIGVTNFKKSSLIRNNLTLTLTLSGLALLLLKISWYKENLLASFVSIFILFLFWQHLQV